MAATREEQLTDIERPVGPFTGFGNFFRKEVTDWWKSWRFLIIVIVMSVIMLMLSLFVLSDMLERQQHRGQRGDEPAATKEVWGARVLVLLLNTHGPGLILYVIIIIVSTMGLLTLEKSSGTLAWNLTKPLGRTGLFLAKWLAATLMLWIGMLLVPMLLATIAIVAYHGFTPDLGKVAPVALASLGWIGLWVLLSLTISLGFHSQAAVAGIMFAFWIIPNVLGWLVGVVLDDKVAMEWILDRLGTNAPFWTWDLFADKSLDFDRATTKPKNVWYWAFVVWFLVLSVLSLRIFNRQEIGS